MGKEYTIYAGKGSDGLTAWMSISKETCEDEGFVASDYFLADTQDIEKAGIIYISGDDHLAPESFDISGN